MKLSEKQKEVLAYMQKRILEAETFNTLEEYLDSKPYKGCFKSGSTISIRAEENYKKSLAKAYEMNKFGVVSLDCFSFATIKALVNRGLIEEANQANFDFNVWRCYKFKIEN